MAISAAPYAGMLKNLNYRVESVRLIERRKDETHEGYKSAPPESPAQPRPKAGRLVDLSI